MKRYYPDSTSYALEPEFVPFKATPHQQRLLDRVRETEPQAFPYAIQRSSCETQEQHDERNS